MIFLLKNLRFKIKTMRFLVRNHQLKIKINFGLINKLKRNNLEKTPDYLLILNKISFLH